MVDDGRAVRLATAASGSVTPAQVRVRSAPGEVGLTLRVDVPETQTADLRVGCVEVRLDEPVSGRRVVDDARGRYNPYRASVTIAKRLLRSGRGCERVPATR